MDFREPLERAKSFARSALTKAVGLWKVLPERGWPAEAVDFFKSPPRWLVAALFVLAAWIGSAMLLRLLLAVTLGASGAESTAEEINKLLLGLAGLISAPFLIWCTWIADRQRHVAQEELYTSLLTKAVEQLGATREEKTHETPEVEHDLFGGTRYGPPPKGEPVVRTVPNTEVRLGGIYALEKLAHDYLPLHWQIMEILCAYVRKNAGAPKLCSDDIDAIYAKAPAQRTEEERAELREREGALKPFVDVQAALTVIGRRSEKQRRFEQREAKARDTSDAGLLDLRACHLGGIDLRGLRFEGADFSRSCLERAMLSEAHLERASLLYAHLQRTWLGGGHLEGSKLYAADLTGARLGKAHIQGADFEMARGLTQRQLNLAIGDEGTTLPHGLVAPVHWPRTKETEEEATPPPSADPAS